MCLISQFAKEVPDARIGPQYSFTDRRIDIPDRFSTFSHSIPGRTMAGKEPRSRAHSGEDPDRRRPRPDPRGGKGETAGDRAEILADHRYGGRGWTVES